MDNLIRLSNRPGVRSALMTGKPVYPYSEQIQPGKPGDGYLGPTLKVGKKEYGVPNPIRIAKDAADNANRANQRKVDQVNQISPGSASISPYKLYNKQTSTASQTLFGMQKQSYEPEGEMVDENLVVQGRLTYGSTPGKATTKSVSSAVDKALANKGTAVSTASEKGKTGVTGSGSISYSGRVKLGGGSKNPKPNKPDKPNPTGGRPKPEPTSTGGRPTGGDGGRSPRPTRGASSTGRPGALMKMSHEPEGEVIDERKMTDGEMKKEKKLRKKYDKGDMKKSMKDQYGEEEGKKIYFAKIRKIAMEGKYSSGSVTYVRGTAPVRDPRTGESYPKETYKKKGMVKTAEEVVREGDGDPCWDTHKQVGMKKKGGKMVPNCVPKEEAVLEMASEKKIDKKIQKPVDAKKLNPADYIKNTKMMPGSGIEKKIAEDWQKKSGKNPEGGLNEKGRKSYERENPGSDLKAPTKKKGNPRRASFCARMKGMKKKLTSKKTANDPDSRINKSLRKWDC